MCPGPGLPTSNPKSDRFRLDGCGARLPVAHQYALSSITMRGNIFTINCMTGRLDALPGHVPIPLWTQNDLRLGSRRAGGLNPSAHRTVLRRRVFRRFGALIAEGLVAGHRARCPRSLPEGHSGREQWRVSGLRSCSLKVSDANETEEPNGGPTTTGIRPHQATSSHSRGWQMPHRATYSHVQRPYDLVLQARGRRFEPCCAHCFSGPDACRDQRDDR